MKGFRKICLALAVLILISFFSSCNLLSKFAPAQTIGVFMPCSYNGKWKNDAEEISDILTRHGYEVLLFYANQNPELQKKQVEETIEYGIDVIIISPVDIYNLDTSLDMANERGIKTIAYDRLPYNTDSINYFTTFDYYLIGVQQAMSLVEGLTRFGDGPYNVELFGGVENDKNAEAVYSGAMSVLYPMIKSGSIHIPSNEISMHDIQSVRGDNYESVKRFEYLLNEYYSDGTPLDGVLSPRDSMSLEFINILDSLGKYSIDNYPVITGQNAEIRSIRAIADSKQYSTIYKDYHLLAAIACSMTMSVLSGETPEINDSTSFYNGVITVPAFLCEPILITKSNYETALIDTGHMSYDDMQP